MNPHLEELNRRYPSLKACSSQIQQAFEMMRDSFRAGGKLLLCGNGGSAADAEHWSGELLKGFCHRRPVPAASKAALGEELAAKLQDALPVIPLNGFLALSSAFANDVDPHLTYAQLAWALGRKGDVLGALSTSGNAKNALLAVRAARARGMRTFALTGESGGALLKEVDLCVRMPETETFKIQELHLPVYHCLCRMLETEFFAS